jgi:hypothetical protein
LMRFLNIPHTKDYSQIESADTIPLNSQGFINGFLFAQVVGVSNSTS